MNAFNPNPVAAIKELMTTHVAWVDEDSLRATLDLVVKNLNSHTPFQRAQHAQPYRLHALTGEPLSVRNGEPLSVASGSNGCPQAGCNPRCKFEDGEATVPSASPDEATVPSASHDEATVPSASPEGYDEPFINVMTLEGDVLRNSGLYAVGSMDMKEYMMEQVDCGATAHIIVINSGGGSAYAVYDFKDMIDYAHQAGQPVVAFVRGMAGSAAYALAMMCDRILTFSDHDIVGSIGSLCALLIHTEDKENQYTFETLRTVYADKSTLKNHAYREAVKGNMEPFHEMANEMCDVFHNLVREYRPAVTEEQLKGDHYDSKDVVGTLVDETGVTFQRAVDVAIDLVEDYRIAALKAGTTVR